MATREELADEATRVRKVRQIVDISTSLIMQTRLTRAEAESLVAHARERILVLFPGREQTYELIYARRFTRLIDEFALPVERHTGSVLPFRASYR